jgi:hypothetical protein
VRILVTGAQEWTNPLLIRMALVSAGPGVVVHPAVPGAATLAATVATSLGWPVEPHLVDRSGGIRAEHRANQALVDLGARVCIAFPLLRSRATWDLVRRCRTAGIPVAVPAPVWQLERGRDIVGLAVFGNAVVEASPTMRWTVGRVWSELFAELHAGGWAGRPIGPARGPAPRVGHEVPPDDDG